MGAVVLRMVVLFAETGLQGRVVHPRASVGILQHTAGLDVRVDLAEQAPRPHLQPLLQSQR